MRRFIPALVAITILWMAGPATAGVASMEQALSEMSIGKADAPVTIYEYSSLTCPHCAAFHKDTLPALKEKYIDTGKVRLVYHDFPLGNLALAGSMLARCAGPEKYSNLVEIMFQTQATWSRSQNPMAELEKLGRLGGMSPDDLQTCLSNEDLAKTLQGRAQEASSKYEINSTPSFRIGDQIIRGNVDVETFEKIIEEALKSAK